MSETYVYVENRDLDALRYALRVASVQANSVLLVEEVRDQHGDNRDRLAAYKRIDDSLEIVTGDPNPYGSVGEVR